MKFLKDQFNNKQTAKILISALCYVKLYPDYIILIILFIIRLLVDYKLSL